MEAPREDCCQTGPELQHSDLKGGQTKDIEVCEKGALLFNHLNYYAKDMKVYL